MKEKKAKKSDVNEKQLESLDGADLSAISGGAAPANMHCPEHYAPILTVGGTYACGPTVSPPRTVPHWQAPGRRR